MEKYFSLSFCSNTLEFWNVTQNYSIYCSIRPISRLALVEVLYRTAVTAPETVLTMEQILYRLTLVGSDDWRLSTLDNSDT